MILHLVAFLLAFIILFMACLVASTRWSFLSKFRISFFGKNFFLLGAKRRPKIAIVASIFQTKDDTFLFLKKRF